MSCSKQLSIYVCTYAYMIYIDKYVYILNAENMQFVSNKLAQYLATVLENMSSAKFL